MEGQRILLKSYSLWQLFLHVEMPLVPVLALMELQPIRVDMPMLLRYSDMLKVNHVLVVTRVLCQRVAGHQ